MRGIKFIVALVCGAGVAGSALADGPGATPRLNLGPGATAPAAPQAVTAPAAPAPQAPPAPAETTPPAAETAVAPAASAATERAGPLRSELPGGLQVNAPSSFTVYSAPEAAAYLKRIGAPAPSGQTLGMIAPAGRGPTDGDFWAAIVSYNPIGRVPEEGALRLSSPDLVTEARETRGAAGPAIESFAVAPAYAPANDTLVWAERRPAITGARTVVHSQRLLGKEGVLKLDAYLTPAQLAEAQAAAPAMLAAYSFAPGSRHGDFKTGEREAEYDLPGLITGRTRALGAAQTAAAAPAAAPEGSLPAWAPWAAIGAAVMGAVAWLAFLMRGRRAPTDPNLTPN